MPPLIGSLEQGRRRTLVKTKPASVTVKEPLPYLSESDSESEDENEENQKQDPDWRKTPLFRKIKSITVNKTVLVSLLACCNKSEVIM